MPGNFRISNPAQLLFRNGHLASITCTTRNTFTAISKTIDYTRFRCYKISGLTPFGIVPSITCNLVINQVVPIFTEAVKAPSP